MTDEQTPLNVGDPSDEPWGIAAKALYTPFIERLPITGVSITVFDEKGFHSTIAASDRTAARIDELQFDLGEGPHWQALREGRPVMIPNVRTADHTEWPFFANAVLELDVGSIFVFPMVMGAVAVGAVSLYRSVPQTLDKHEFHAALSLTARVGRGAVYEALQLSKNDNLETALAAPAMRREVHQATGMILVQLNATASEAFFRLRAYAFANGRTVQDVARDVVSRNLDFSNLPD